jgi:LacI family transcriptional regulator
MPRPPKGLAAVRPSATIRDVAAKAGVSVATVSRVFNRKGPIRQDTIQRVMEVATALQYVPHAGARSLSTRSTRTIGVVLPDLHGEFFSEVIRGIDLAARQAGFHLLLSGSHADREEMRAVVQAMRGLVDGLVVMSPDLEASALVAELPAGLPVVMLNARVGGHPCVTIDNSGGAREMVRHLYEAGHRTIAFISGPAHNADAEQRRRGYRSAMSTLGLLPQEIDGRFTEESGYEAGRSIASAKKRPSAVFAANDAMAIGALSAFNEAGLSIPEDIALAGFDDIPIARFLTPALTTVKVPIAELGRRGFEMLIGAEASRRASKLTPSLVVRRSCGAKKRTASNQPIPFGLNKVR